MVAKSKQRDKAALLQLKQEPGQQRMEAMTTTTSDDFFLLNIISLAINKVWRPPTSKRRGRKTKKNRSSER
jgi:hypothetical protein